FFFFSSRRRHTRSKRDWSSDVCSSDLLHFLKFLVWHNFVTSTSYNLVLFFLQMFQRKVCYFANVFSPAKSQFLWQTPELQYNRQSNVLLLYLNLARFHNLNFSSLFYDVIYFLLSILDVHWSILSLVELHLSFH